MGATLIYQGVCTKLGQLGAEFRIMESTFQMYIVERVTRARAEYGGLIDC